MSKFDWHDLSPIILATMKKQRTLETISRSFVQRQKRIAIYHVKKFVKESQLWKQTLSILPDFLENWHFLSHFVWKSTKTLKLLRIFDEIFDVINGDPFLTLHKTSASGSFINLKVTSRGGNVGGWACMKNLDLQVRSVRKKKTLGHCST